MSDVFKEHHLNLLDAVYRQDHEIIVKLSENLKIDFNNLTEDDINKLREFETKNQQYLINKIRLNDVHEKHRMRLDWFILGFAFIYLPSITFIPLTETGYRVADTILGVVVGVLIGSVLGYWYDGVAHKKED